MNLSSFGQNDILCAFVKDNVFDNSASLQNLEFINSQEASVFVEVLLGEVGLPMNFHVQECNEINCSHKRNAYAKMNKNGTRFIVYDNEWFASLDTSETKIESLTILAHEIGHHLAAHTIQRNHKKYVEACKYCRPKSKHFNKEICEKEFSKEYSTYLANRRIQELQADRFAGFIMNYYGASKGEVCNIFNKISKIKDDSNSTHPSLEKRLKAVEEGFELAQEYKIKGKKIDLNDIKRLPIEIDITNKTIVNRNKLISEVSETIRSKPIQYIRKHSKLKVNAAFRGGAGKKIEDRMTNYLGIEKLGNHIISEQPEFEYFKYFNQRIEITYDNKINYNPFPAMHIKNNELFILIFEDEMPTIIYRSKFEKEQISFKEIETLLIEIYNDGLNNKLEKLNNKN